MKSRVRETNCRQIIKISLITIGILIISLNIFNNKLSINPLSSVNYNLPEREENNNLNSKFNPHLSNTYASGITSSVNNDSLIIYSTCSILGFIGLSQFSIILKRKKDKNSDVYNDKASTISSQGFENLDSKEYIVLEVVKEYLSKNRSFDKDAVVRYTVSRFANTNTIYNKNGIKEILQSLFDKKLIVDGSKLLQNDILQNPNRKKVFNCIINNPGIPFMEIVRTLNMSNFLVKWHLDMLLRFNFIRKQNIDNREAYFDSHFKSQDDKLMHLLSIAKYRKILDYLKFNDGVTKNKLSKELVMHPTTISKYIKNLEACGLLLGKKYSNRILYFINEDF